MRMNCGIVAPFIAVRYDFTTPFTMEGTGTKRLNADHTHTLSEPKAFFRKATLCFCIFEGN